MYASMKLLAALSCFAFAAPIAAAPGAPATLADRAIYHLDFELVTTEAGKPASMTTFALNLEEDHAGEVMIGDNIALASGSPNATVRQNVGLRVGAHVQTRGAGVLVEVDSELTSMASGSSMHKLQTKDVALAAPGKKTVVSIVDHDHTRTQLSVTATRL